MAFESSAELDELPPEFDPVFYRSIHVDLEGLDEAALLQHWQQHGISEGRVGSPAATRSGFLRVLERSESVLEIGPLANPMIRGPHVRYFDVLPTDALRKKAEAHQLDPSLCPEITYYSETADLSVIPDKFDAVVSSHAIEHQPDLIHHLSDVSHLLANGGRYFLAIPDHRYCFDHFQSASTIADVIGSHLRGVVVHDPANVIDTFAMQTHNDAGRHWNGDHGEPDYRSNPQLLTDASEHFLANASVYIDTHAWQFTPGTFREITSVLAKLGLSALEPLRVYETIRGSLEFYAVLQLSELQPTA